MPEKYDVCVIGSGIGGLTCGAFLAHAGKKVLVLEKHDRIGGYAHNFKRRGYKFESSIHSVPMAPHGFIVYLLKLLGIENRIQTIELPSMFSMQTPEMAMTMPGKKDAIIEFFLRQFPGQKEHVAMFLKEVERFSKELIQPLYTFEQHYTWEDMAFVTKFHNKSYQDFIQKIFSDQSLRNLFYGQWPYIGSAPNYAPNLFSFMMFLVHFNEGSYICKDGFSTLADALASVITSNGGAIKLRTRVTDMTVDKKQVRSIATDKKDEIDADIFISNISPYILHRQLIKKEHQSKRWLQRLEGLKPSTSCVIAYLGMKSSFVNTIPQPVSFWYESCDFAHIFSNVLHDRKDAIDHLVLLKSSQNPQYPTVTMMNFVQKSFSKDWKSEKLRIADMMITKAEELFPGIKDNIELMEVGSPATFERYTANTDGALYGFENTSNMYQEAKMPIHTHLTNLFQTGHWGKPGCGIWNVMANAYTVAKWILRTK